MEKKLENIMDNVPNTKYKLLSIKQASQYLNVSQDTLRKWEKNEAITPFKTVGGHRRYSVESLNNILYGFSNKKEKIKEWFSEWYNNGCSTCAFHDECLHKPETLYTICDFVLQEK
jgi:excisionase family DNA binding protein